MGQQVAFNLEQLDDPVVPDGNPAFNGGQVSNERSNLLQPNQAAKLQNCEINQVGKIMTRRGSTRLGSGAVGSGTYIQGLINFFTSAYNYLVAVCGGKLYQWTGSVWSQIALGGVVNNDNILIQRQGTVNNTGGYPIGTTVLTISGVTGVIPVGAKFIFPWDGTGTSNAVGNYQYTVTAHVETTGNTTQITIDNPGLVKAVQNTWLILFHIPAQVNNVAGYPGGTTTIAMDNFTGAVNTGETFVIQGENVWHTISGHSETGGNTTSITFSPGLQGAFSGDVNNPYAMVVGNDTLYWCDGVGSIYSWDGVHTGSLANGNLFGQYNATVTANTKPPTACTVLVWFQSRLIASGIAATPDAVWFSNFLDPTTWDSNFQQVRIGGGDGDAIVALVGWSDLNLVVLKRQSIWLVNCDPSQSPDPTDPTLLVGSFAIKLINKNIGCLAQRSASQIGGGTSIYGVYGIFMAGDIMFLSDSGVRSLKRVLAAETQQEVGAAISFPINDMIERITPGQTSKCCAFYHNARYMLAVPLDGATNPNFVLVYNTLTQSWSGFWTGWLPTCFAVLYPDYPGLCFGQSDGTVNQWLDDVPDNQETASTFQDNGVDIATGILSRGYTAGDLFNPKTGLNAEFEFDGSSAVVSIQAILDLVPQSQLVGDAPFSSASGVALILPQVLPFTLSSNILLQKSFDLMKFGQWREIQFFISATAQKLSMRTNKLTCFQDTIVLQK